MKQMKKSIFIGLLSVIFALSLLTACTTYKKKSEIEFENANYQAYTAGFAYTKKEIVDKKSVSNSQRDLTLEKSEDYDVEYEAVTATGSYDDICTMGVNNDILYPGALVDTSNSSYRSIAIKRAPITLSTNLETVANNSSSLSTTIDNPTLSSVRNGIRKIVNNNISADTALPINLTYEIKEITNETEFYMNLGFGLQISKFALSENFSYDNLKKQTNLVIVLKQIYYTVDMDAPQEYNSRDLFASKLSNADINKALKGTIPAYVSSVSYGRVAMIAIQTNFSKQEIENALSVSWGKMSENAGVSSSKKLGVEFDDTLRSISTDNDTSINCYIYGGSASSSQSIAITSTSEALSNIFSNFNAGGEGALPISYTMRHLNGELAKVQSYNEYVIKHVTYNPKKLMNWSYLDTLLQNGSFFESNSLKLDFSAMIDYSNPKKADTNANKTLTIPDNILDLYLIGPNRGAQNIEYNGLSIYVDYRTTPLVIHLDSISFNADEGPTHGAQGIAILSKSDALVTLDVSRTVVLRGKKGASAIECKNLKITGSADMSIYGGDGIDGTADSVDGTNGGVGILSNSLTIELTGSLSIYGGNGGNGATGADGIKSTGEKKGTDGKIGGNGGDGNFAVFCKTLNVDCYNITLIGGNGGNGGDGGKGGNGEVVWSGSGNYDAGNGGDGGVGGNGCASLQVSDTCKILGDLLVITGDGGDGGKGGKGGDGKIHSNGGTWIVADYYKKGAPGDGGNGGDGGAKGEETIFTENISVQTGVAGNGGAGGDGGAPWQITNWAGTARKPSSTKYGNPGKSGKDGN